MTDHHSKNSYNLGRKELAALPYVCEVLACKKVSEEKYLCDIHREMAKDHVKYQVVYCSICMRIVGIDRKTARQSSLRGIEQCPACRKE